MAGVAFDHLEQLATTGAAATARELLAQESERERARGAIERLLRTPASGFSAETSKTYRAILKSGETPAGGGAASHPEELTKFIEASHAVRALTGKLQETLESELESARANLGKSSRNVLPGYLVFGAGEFRERLDELSAGHSSENGHLPHRNSRTREQERHLLLYLQRVCAKNDTFSEFGPSGWGTIERQQEPLKMLGSAEVTQRCAFLERWTAHAFAAAIDGDPEARRQLAPRLHPNGRLENGEFVLTDTGVHLPLAREEAEALSRVNGQTPAHSLGLPDETLAKLAERRVLLWQAEVPALDPHAFAALLSDVERWQEGAARTRWLSHGRRVAALPEEFVGTTEVRRRSELMGEARGLLEELGARQTLQRSLYTAANPIAEECFINAGFSISAEVADGLARDMKPWVDLWRDTYSFVASRVAETLRGLLQQMAVQNGAIPLPAFFQHCAANRLPLTGHGIVAPAHMAFQEVKALFRKVISARPDAAEWQMTAEDCAFVRDNFDYPKFDEYTYPSADLQISASSAAAVERSEFEWIVSELHPPIAIMHHALFWSCPDKPALSRALASSTFGRPSAHYGFFAADFTAHTAVRQMDALPDLTNFVAAQRANPRWRSVPPSEVEVYLEEASGDVCLRTRGSHRHLGSFARSWIIPLGFHPFHFGRAPHMPRLRCGNAIVQRRSWAVNLDELAPGKYSGISAALVLAIEKLRAEKGLPRYIYIRPTEQALRRSGAEGRDKDTKPVFVDLESYLSLEVFHRWLVKAGELEVTEMLPDPDHLCWQESTGRRTFELRTLIIPRG